jgi:hypothetical protein
MRPAGRAMGEAAMAFVTRIFGLSCTLAIVVPLAAVVPVTAETTDDVAKFYRGKTVNAVVGYGPGSTFELYLRILTRHIGRHIPGNPTVVLQQMPGAGSLKATNYLAAVAPKDLPVARQPQFRDFHLRLLEQGYPHPRRSQETRNRVRLDRSGVGLHG